MRMLTLAALAALSLIACRNEPEPVDADGDGVVEADDCNDAVATVFPGATETCNGVDDNCDGVIDNDASDAITYYQDADSDGFGATGKAVTGCDAPAGYVTADADCDDLDATSFPGAAEEDCTDPVDHNCDGSVGYADADADAFPACLDCDDTAAAVNPDASELCDGLDNNCDGNTDEAGALGEATWYADADADGQGNPRAVRIACDQPTGYVSNADDCNDAAAASLKGGVEVCDGLDNDCDGTVDMDATDAATWYHDGDLDAHGNPGLSVLACAQPVGFVASSDDCNDNNATAFPGSAEVCDTVDNNCDGAVDEGVGSTWYQDADRDGHGLAGTAQTACAQPAGYVASSDDCNDANNKAYPGATEVCDDVDNNCDSAVDEGFNKTWYIDYDEDSYGKSRVSLQSCSQPLGFVKDGGDCDDLNAAIHPSAAEVCDTIDNDCDGAVDDADPSVTAQTTWYADADLDSYGDVNGTVLACFQPDARIADGGDCDDTAPDVNPGVADVPYNGVDDNCYGNDAPGAPTIELTPAAPAPTDDIVCGVTVDAPDTESDTITYTVTWTLGGAPWTGATSTTALPGDTIASADTSASDVWECTVTPNDGHEDGEPVAASVSVAEPNGVCGPNLHLDPIQLTPGWTMCYVTGTDALSIRTAACNTLFDSVGKQYGCWHGTCTYPHENCNGVQDSACRPNIQNSTRYADWSGTAHVLGVCIKN